MLEACYGDVFSALLPRRVLLGRGARHGGVRRNSAHEEVSKRLTR